MGGIVNVTSVILFSAAFVFLMLCGTAFADLPLACNSVVDSCCNADSPGATYVLGGPLASEGTCIRVTAENVTIDCGGFSITGSDTGYGISSDQYNTSITNCNIFNFSSGIYLNSFTNTITNTVLTSPSGYTVVLPATNDPIIYPFFSVTQPNVFGDGPSIDISGNSNITNVVVTIDGNQYFDGTPQAGVKAVNITSDGLPLVSFDYNFTGTDLNFSNVAIEDGTSPDGLRYVSINGLTPARIIGGKTIYMRDASPEIGGVCVKDEEGAVYASISSTCTGQNEVSIACDGASYSGYTCSFSGTTAVISGLQHSAAMQFAAASGALPAGQQPVGQQPAPAAPSGGNNQGASGLALVIVAIALVAGAAVFFAMSKKKKNEG